MLSGAVEELAVVKVARSFSRDTAVVFVGMSLLNGANFVFHGIATRWLAVDEYGLLAAVLAAISIALLPSAIAQLVAARFAAELGAKSASFSTISQFEKRALVGSTVFAVTLTIAGLFLAPAIARLLNTADTASIMLLALSMGLAVPLPVARGLVQGREAFRGLAISLSIEGCTKVAVCLLALRLGLGLHGCLIAIALSYGASVFYCGVILTSRWGRVFGLVCGLPSWRGIAQASGGAASALAIVTILTYSDVVVARSLYPADVAGHYAALGLCGKIVLFITGFVPFVLVPRAAAARVSGANPEGLLSTAAFIVLPVLLGTVVVCLAIPTVFLRVLAGAKYVDVAPLLVWYGLAAASLGSANVVLQYRIAVHRLDFILPGLMIAASDIIMLVFVGLRFGGMASLVGVTLIADIALLAVALLGARPVKIASL